MSLIEIKGITKDYGKTRALDNIGFTIEANKIYGLLGRNGAGKTTLLNLMTNKIFPTSGDITIDGETAFENDKMLGRVFYMMEKNLYPESLRVRDAFKWTKEYYSSFDMKYADRLAASFGLITSKRIKGLSTGYASIFKAIVALASNAEIIVFDEPVLGLDANHRDLFYKELIANYSEKPKTIIISTHLIEEVAEVLEEVIIIDNGKLVKKQSVEQLLETAYNVSGAASNVDKYIENRKSIGAQTMGKFKSVVVLEEYRQKNEALAKELDIEFSKVELQKLFINLTNSKGGL